MKIARIYLRVSTASQDIKRQEAIVTSAKLSGYYIAAVYSEKASGARTDRPELIRMIRDLQPGETVVAEKIDRISRLPLKEAEKLINSIKEKGAKLAIPGVVDFSDITGEADDITKIVLNAVQDLLLKIALQMSRDEYETRQERQKQGIERAKKEGVVLGRKRSLTDRQIDQALELKKKGLSNAEICKQLSVHRSTLYRAFKQIRKD